MSIVLVGSTSGSITLQEPAVAGTTVLDLPATSGTFITTGSSGQSIPKAALPTGSVLQVVNATYGTATTSSSASYSDTGLTASITPTSSSSKILVIVSQSGLNTGSANNGINVKLVRGGTDLIVFAVAYNFSGGGAICGASASYLDSPATTSSTTYKTQQARFSGAGAISTQANSDVSTITLMEIAA
jgi:hypothetical protein